MYCHTFPLSCIHAQSGGTAQLLAYGFVITANMLQTSDSGPVRMQEIEALRVLWPFKKVRRACGPPLVPQLLLHRGDSSVLWRSKPIDGELARSPTCKQRHLCRHAGI